ncbi:MAG: zf-HC2 domain-containing protein [Anaerolineae bacterium]
MFAFIKHWTKTEHELCQEDLSAFLDGQLTPQERLRVERHLEKCTACRRDLASLQQIVDLLRVTPAIKPPRSFFIPASERARSRQLQRTRLAYGYMRVATAMATVLLVLVVSGDALLRFASITPASPMPVAIPEVRTFEAEAPSATQTVVPPIPPTAMLSVAETPTAIPFTIEGAVPQQSPEPTGLAMLALPTAREAVPQEEAVIIADSQTLGAKAMPSQTFARSAGPPAAATASPEVEAPSVPSAEVKSPTVAPSFGVSAVPTIVPETLDRSGMPPATPEPTSTPVPTPMPLSPTATPTPLQTSQPPTTTSLSIQTPLPTVSLPSPQPILGEKGSPEGLTAAPVDLWMILLTIRLVLPWLEWMLGILVALLLAITLWLRQAQRSP